MYETLEKIKTQAIRKIKEVKQENDLEKWRVEFLGRKSALSLFLRQLKTLPLNERKFQGKKANQLKQFLHSLYQKTKEQLTGSQEKSWQFDITRPGIKPSVGHLHPLTLTIRQIVSAFQKLSFEIIEGPEIETEYYNFDALRIPPEHPARDMWDTFWLNSPQKNKNQSSKFLLRTHTSPVQIRYMEKHQPPFRIIVPGKCFRHEATDSSHDFQFHQIEGLMVGSTVSLANFKSIIEDVLRKIFSQSVLIRFRPSYFPFVTPGIEVDIKLPGKRSKWLEVMGAGMVHPELFDVVGYNKNNWQGFAFGLGVERIAMIKYHIPDIRLFATPDIRFLRQF